MKRVVISTIALVSVLALQGCAAEADSAVLEKAPVTSEEITEAPAASEFPADFFSIPYQDAYKTIYLLDRAQVEAVAGVALSSGTEQQVKDALGNAALWQSDERSAEHATLIIEAFAREGNSTSQALRALQDNPTAHLKVYVGHSSHKAIAHIEIDNED